MTGVCFVDTETTGLDPDRHPIWEVALIVDNGAEHVWQFPVNEVAADPFALDIGRWWDRRWPTTCDVAYVNAVYDADNEKSRRKNFPDQGLAIVPSAEWCRRFRDLVGTSHLCGAVPSFDEERLRRLLLSHGVRPRWHYHLVDVEALAAGWLAGHQARHVASGEPMPERYNPAPPWDSHGLSDALGVDPEDFDRHTALGDARWAKAIYEAVMGR